MFLGIDLHISDVKNSNYISIRICKRKYCIALKQFIINNNLFYFSRKWDIIKFRENEQ